MDSIAAADSRQVLSNAESVMGEGSSKANNPHFHKSSVLQTQGKHESLSSLRSHLIKEKLLYSM